MSGEDSELTDATRRAVIKATAGALGVGAMGSASAHEWQSGPNESEIEGGSPSEEDTPGNTVDAEVVGYHSLGSVGSETTNGPRAPHYGAQTEIRTRGDYAYVSFFSSDAPTPGRGMAIIDISSYNDAANDDQAAAANMSVLSFVRNNSTETAVMDLKVSDDGEYVFFGTQPYTALFGDEAADPTPNTGDHGFTEAPGAVVAVDVSDKGNPETVGAFQVSGTGVHNLFHHRIGQDDYVFAIHDLNDGTEGMYVFEFDRATGQLEPVNRWTLSGNTRQREVNPDLFYIHDVEVQDDPITGVPTAYLSYWGKGLQVLDVSDPEDITQIGQFDMRACHFTSPAPKLWEAPDGSTKRVAVASQEISANDSRTGRIHLVDVSGIYDADETVLDVPSTHTETDGVTQLTKFDTWEWQNTDGTTETPDSDSVSFDNFQLSPHNSDIVIDEDDALWIHQAHYHGGIRYLKGVEESGGLGLTQEGFSRPKYNTPRESRMQGLSEVVPNCWAAVESNGITFASDINQGVHAVKADGIEYGGAPAAADITRSDDAALFTGGQTDRIDLTVQFLDRYDEVKVRDRLPASWGAFDADGYETYDEGGATYVEFDDEARQGETLTYFAKVGSETDGATVGPTEVSTDGGETWQALPGTLETNFVVGQSTNLTLGTAAGAVGAMAHQRDRLRDGLSRLVGNGEE